MNILLAGFQGVGKTSCGKALAAKLGAPFIDTDALLCNLHGVSTARALYTTLGEEAFRKEEAAILQGLKSCKNSVIALGGGSLLAPGAQEYVPQLGKLFYLYLPLEVMLYDTVRFCGGSFLAGASFETLYAMRHELFTRVCHEVIDVQHLDIQEIVDSLLMRAAVRRIGTAERSVITTIDFSKTSNPNFL